MSNSKAKLVVLWTVTDNSLVRECRCLGPIKENARAIVFYDIAAYVSMFSTVS